MLSLPDDNNATRLLNGVDIPPCPAVLLDIRRAMDEEAPDNRRIARLISKDPALAGQVMRVANSSAFSGGPPIDSIIQALTVLGSGQLFNLVVSQLIKIALAGPPEVQLDRFWETSALTARVAAELSRRLRRGRPDVAYTFGLFHDCGIPLLMKRFPETRDVLARANAEHERPFSEIEEELLGTNHSVVGYFLARRWRLPDVIAQGILGHHDFSVLHANSPWPETVKGLISLQTLAEHVIRRNQDDEELEWAKAAPFACPILGISLASADDLIDDILEWLP